MTKGRTFKFSLTSLSRTDHDPTFCPIITWKILAFLPTIHLYFQVTHEILVYANSMTSWIFFRIFWSISDANNPSLYSATLFVYLFQKKYPPVNRKKNLIIKLRRISLPWTSHSDISELHTLHFFGASRVSVHFLLNLNPFLSQLIFFSKTSSYSAHILISKHSCFFDDIYKFSSMGPSLFYMVYYYIILRLFNTHVKTFHVPDHLKKALSRIFWWLPLPLKFLIRSPLTYFSAVSIIFSHFRTVLRLLFLVFHFF